MADLNITQDEADKLMEMEKSLEHIIKSTDGAASWTTLSVSNLKRFDMVLIDRADANVIYVVGDGRLLKSTDGGASWTTASSGIIGPVYKVVVDPSKSTILYALSSTGVFKSVDGGVTWAPSNSGNGSALAIDPNNPAVLYLGAVSGVLKTVDAATSWTAVNGGLDIQRLYALAVRAGTLYAGTADNGVFQSGDGGASWARASNSLPRQIARALVIDQTNSSTVYAGIWNSGVYKSVDGGANWTGTLGRPGVTALAIDPTNSAVLYAGIAGTVFKSVDGGANWDAFDVSPGNASSVNNIAVDPLNPENVLPQQTWGFPRAPTEGRVGLRLTLTCPGTTRP
jgi:photosystem II stability/assembly factor-like uncharacterized protein